MPRNRQEIPRDERILAIVDAATSLFSQRDFADVTMADIARATGIQSAAIYWYFESKDHVLAAVVDRTHELSVQHLGEEELDALPTERLVRHLTALRPTRPIHASAHARAQLSPAVAEAHDRLMEHLRALIGDALREREAAEREMLTSVMVALFEGANDPRHRGPSATEMIAFVLEHLAQPSASLGPGRATAGSDVLRSDPAGFPER